jgi:multiple sugar transport system permease protein
MENGRIAPWLFATPAIVMFLCLIIYPATEGLILGFVTLDLNDLENHSLFSSASFVGLFNYIALFSDQSFIDSLSVLLHFSVVTTFAEVVFALLVALAFEYFVQPPRLVRTLLLVPMFVIPLVSGLTFRYIFDPSNGTLGEFFRLFGAEAPDLLGSPRWAFWLVVLQDFWRMWPFVFLILAAGLKTIPAELMEAFEVDGGTRLQAIFRIVLPLLVPSLAVACGLKVIESLKAFTEIYTMTGGGPGSSTTTLSMFIVREGTEYFHLPAASAAGSLLLVSGIAMGVVYAIFQNRRGPVASQAVEKGVEI